MRKIILAVFLCLLMLCVSAAADDSALSVKLSISSGQFFMIFADFLNGAFNTVCCFCK